MDNGTDNFLWYMIAGTRGGPNRLFILKELAASPANANQLSSKLALDYKTIRHHLEILAENGLVKISKEQKYGERYSLSDFAKAHIKNFEKALPGAGGKNGND